MSPLLDIAVEHSLGDFRLDARFISDGRLTALFGRSGSGKTSLINVIGGLIRPASGHVRLDGEALVDTKAGLFVPKHRRRIGYVFQEARLFPHLTVRQNLLFGRWFSPRRSSGAELGTILDLLGIGHLLARMPAGLSGGEKQRVAIGRALLSNPRLLLMDEPLAALDEARKAEILPYIERLRDEIGIPIVYVSHSVAEVARLATTLVIVDHGRVAASGPTAEVMSRLDVPQLSGAPESGSLIEAEILDQDPNYDLTRLKTRAGLLQVSRIAALPGARVRVRILASDVLLSLTPPQGVSALNILPGVVAEIGQMHPGGAVELILDCQGIPLLVRLTAKSVTALALRSGTPVHAVIKSVSVEIG